MNSRESASLDRYITGNYGENQFRSRQKDPKFPKWSEGWLQFATDSQLAKALAQAVSNVAYLSDSFHLYGRVKSKRIFMWERRREAVEREIEVRKGNFCIACQTPFDKYNPCNCDAAGMQPIPVDLGQSR